MAADMPQKIRELSPIERFSASRHKLGLYHCVVVTARYQHSQPHGQGRAHPLYHALATLIRRHGMLRAGIVEDVDKPYYCHTHTVDLRNHVEFASLPCSTQQEYETRLAQLQGALHDKRWTNMYEVPPWRITVATPHDGQDGQKEEDLMFAFHHSLMDGAAARMFHEQLLAALDYPSCAARDNEADQVLRFPTPPDLPPSREDLIPQTLSKTFIASVLYDELAPAWAKPAAAPFWRGEPIAFSAPRRTRILPVEVKPEALKALLDACRARGTTLTGLVHALVLGSLARRVLADDTAGLGLKSATVIDCRSVAPVAPNRAYRQMLASCVSLSTEQHPAQVVSAFRAADPRRLDELIWSNAARIRALVAARRDSLPQDDPIMLLKWVGDMDGYFRKKDGTARAETWEVSNLGVLDGSPPLAESPASHGWRITRAVFSNGAGTTGPAFIVNMVSVPRGSLVITVSCGPHTVSDEVAEGLASDLDAWLTGYAANGRFAAQE